jgi:acyl-CoA thioester hydrolase
MAPMRVTFQPSTDVGAYRFCHRVRVRFADTDAMGVVNHAAYLPYLEEARVEYLRSVGHPFGTMREEGFELPVVELTARYLRPVVFDELVDVHLVLAAARAASFEMGYLLTVGGEPRVTAVSLHAVTGADGRPRRCPAWLLALAEA